MKVRKPVIKNKVYSEILILMGYRKVYANKFVEEFENPADIFMGENLNKKKQPVLFRQLEILKEEGYLNTEKGSNKNKTYYFIVWEKIIESFIDYAIDYINKIKTKNKEQKAIIKESINKLGSKTFRSKCKRNFYIKELLLNSFCQIGGSYEQFDMTIEEVFKYLLQTNMIQEIGYKASDELRARIRERFRDKVKAKAKSGKEYYELSKKYEHKLDAAYRRYINKDKDYLFFLDFADVVWTGNMGFLDFLFREVTPYRFCDVLLSPKKKKESDTIIPENYL